MNCPRCGGCLAIERSIDFYNSEGQWKCINCGAHTSFHTPVSRKFASQALRTVFNASDEKI